jgi:hypothetical protein
MTQSLDIELLGEMKNQTASQVIDLQQDFMGIEKRRWTLADDREIPIQKSQQLALGLTYKNKRWLFTIDNFYKSQWDFNAGPGLPEPTRKNQTQWQLQGLGFGGFACNATLGAFIRGWPTASTTTNTILANMIRVNSPTIFRSSTACRVQ